MGEGILRGLIGASKNKGHIADDIAVDLKARRAKPTEPPYRFDLAVSASGRTAVVAISPRRARRLTMAGITMLVNDAANDLRRQAAGAVESVVSS